MENEVYPSLEEKNSPVDKEDVKVNVGGGDEQPAGNGSGRAEEVNESQVKFLPSGDSKEQGAVQITNGPAGEEAFSGMSKQELMKYADDPYWVKVRWALIILCFLVWIAILAGAIIIVVLAPRCPAPGDPEWWNGGSIYRLVVQTFKDSDGDGIGDFEGIASKSDYLKSLGVDAVWLSPIYPTGKEYDGYDVTDLDTVDEMELGPWSDFKSMVSQLHAKGIKVILDFIPNHTSVKHKWFLASRNESDPNHDKYKDYYVWSKCENGPPNNWEDVQGEDAWLNDDVRKECFYHVKMKHTADLNMWNSYVRDEIKSILSHWMDAGVDGFYINDALRLYENSNITKNEKKGTNYQTTDHTETVGRNETFDLLAEWKDHIRNYKKNVNSYRVMMSGGELAYADRLVSSGSDLQLAPELAEISNFCGSWGQCLKENVGARIGGVKKDNINHISWKMSGVEYKRLATRVGGRELVSPLLTLLLLLPGTPTTYYGEEIGMKDATVQDIPIHRAQDTFATSTGTANYASKSRDFHRTPMQWSGEANAGFSTTNKSTWLPLPADRQILTDINVKVIEEAGPGSILYNFKEAIKLRKSCDTFKFGDFRQGPEELGLYTFIRAYEDMKYLVLVNLGNGEALIPSLAKINETSTSGEVVFTTVPPPPPPPTTTPSPDGGSDSPPPPDGASDSSQLTLHNKVNLTRALIPERQAVVILLD